MEWEYAYSETTDYFGERPTPILKDHLDQLDRMRPVLDVGTGQGRNAVFLAREGITVDAIDPSATGVEMVAGRAAKEKLPIRSVCAAIEDFEPEVTSYGGILGFGLIQILTWQSIETLRNRIEHWTTAGSLIYLTAWTKHDPSYARCLAEKWEPIGQNSFRNNDGVVRTYLEDDQILELFAAYSVVYHWEGLGPEHQHGDSPPERHGHIDAVFRR